MGLRYLPTVSCSWQVSMFNIEGLARICTWQWGGIMALFPLRVGGTQSQSLGVFQVTIVFCRQRKTVNYTRFAANSDEDSEGIRSVKLQKGLGKAAVK